MKSNANIAGVIPDITGTLYLNNNTTMSLTNRDFVAGSIKQTSGTSVSGEFSVGGAVIGGLDFELQNESGRFDNINWYDSRVHIYFTVGNTTVDGGYYWVVDHHETGSRIRVECHDCLKLLDEYEIYELNITWPSTVSAVVNAIATARGLNVVGLTGGSTVLVDPQNDHMTQRACLSYIAQLLGKYVTGFGYNLRFGWYDTSSAYSVGTSFSHDLRTDMQTITGVVVNDKEESSPQTRGTSTYRIEISDNPFITADNVSAVADTIYAAVNGISYRPGDVEILSNPAIEAGDRLSVNTATESGVIVLATDVTYKPGSVKMRVTADAEPYAGDLRIKRKKYIKQIAEEVAEEVISGGGGGGNKNETIVVVVPQYTDVLSGTSVRIDSILTTLPNIMSSNWTYLQRVAGSHRQDQMSYDSSTYVFIAYTRGTESQFIIATPTICGAQEIIIPSPDWIRHFGTHEGATTLRPAYSWYDIEVPMLVSNTGASNQINTFVVRNNIGTANIRFRVFASDNESNDQVVLQYYRPGAYNNSIVKDWYAQSSGSSGGNLVINLDYYSGPLYFRGEGTRGTDSTPCYLSLYTSQIGTIYGYYGHQGRWAFLTDEQLWDKLR